MSTRDGLLGTLSGVFAGVTDGEVTTKQILLWAIALTVVVLVVIPLIFLLWASVWSGYPGQFSGSFTLENFRAVYLDGFFDVAQLVLNSLTVAVAMTVTGSALGLAFAWLFVRTNLPTKSHLELVLLSGQAVPGYIYAFMYIAAYDSDSGFISTFLRDTTGTGIPFSFATPLGTGFVIGITVIPTFYLLIVPALQDMDPALEEIGRIYGTSVWGTLREITVPLIKPAILSGGVVVFLYGLGEFAVVAILGVRGGFDVYSTTIFDAVRTRFPPAYGKAAALACSLILIMFILVWYYRTVTQRKEDYMTLTGEGGRMRTWDLGRWRWPIALTLWAGLLLVWLLPIIVMIIVSLHTTWRGYLDLSALTLSHYVEAITDPQLQQAFTNSVLVAVGGATLGTILVVGLSYYTERTDGRFRGVVDFLSLTPLAVPGIIMGSSLLFTFLWVGNVAPVLSLYGTLGIIIIGCVVVYIPVSSRIAIGNIVQIHTELEEAARIAGASWLREMKGIFLPLFRNTTIVIWFFLAIHIFQLLSIPAMTYTSDTVVIPIHLFQMWAYDPNIQLLSAISTIFVGLTVLAMLALRYVGITFYDLGGQ